MRLPAAMLLLFPLLAAGQAIHTIYSTKDAVLGYHYGINSANTNYNSADWYGAMSQPGNHGGPNHSRSLIYFDLSDYAPGTPIDDASLDLFGRGAVSGGGDAASVGNIGNNVCVIERITSAWQDNTVTWNTSPATTGVNAVTLPVSTQVIQDYEGIDVTAMVQDMINNPSTSHGFLLRLVDENPTRALFFCGNGYSIPTKRPRLNVKVNTISVPENTVSPSITLHPNPVQGGGLVRIEWESGAADWTVDLVDGLGRLAARVPASSNDSFVIPIHLEPGLYVPVLTSKSFAATRLSVLQVIETR